MNKNGPAVLKLPAERPEPLELRPPRWQPRYLPQDDSPGTTG